MSDASCGDEKVLRITKREGRGVRKSSKTSEDSDNSSDSDVRVCRLGVLTGDDDLILETDPFFQLPLFQSLLYTTILENVIISCTILNACNNHLRLLKTYDDLPSLLSYKYGVAKPAIVHDELDLIDPKRLSCNEYQRFKLERDRDDFMTAMKETYRGMVLSKSFRPLWNFCQDATELELYRENLINDTAKNKVLARTLHRQLRQLRVQHTTANYETNCAEDELRKQIQDAEHMCSIKERYIEKWQSARAEQHDEEIGQKQATYADSIEYHKKRLEQETIVHGEIEMLVNIAIQEKQQRIEELMVKYEEDTERMDLQIQIAMSDLNKISEKRLRLTDLLNRRTQEIKDWIKFKEDRAETRKYHDKMTRSAITVQAWWRGLLVRKQLGPYRPKKEKKVGRKKAEKGK